MCQFCIFVDCKISCLPQLKKMFVLLHCMVVASVWGTYAALAMHAHLAAIKDDWKKSFWKNIHFGKVMVQCGVNQMIRHFSEASILSSVRSSIHPLLQIILVLNLQCGMEQNEYRPPNSSDDLCLLFCLFLLLCPAPKR